MALFDQIYNNKNAMQDIEDTEVLESIEKIGKKNKKYKEDKKSNKRKRIISILFQIAKYIDEYDIDPDEVSIKISIGKNHKIRIKKDFIRGYFK